MQTSSIPYADLDTFSALFQAYVAHDPALAPFFNGDFSDPQALQQAAARAAEHPRDRNALADVLLDQNAAWGADDHVRAQIERLRQPDAVAVVTGQQLGLFLGPLYTVYKTVTAIQLAQHLEAETGRPVVPVFWLEGEDHDLEEVAETHVLQGNAEVTLRYTGHQLPEDGNLGPVGRLAFTDQITEVVDALEAALPPTDFKPALMEMVRAAYRPGHTFRDAFALLMRSLFPEAGLVFIYPDDARLKALVKPLFRKEIEDHATSFKKLTDTSTALSTAYHAQVYPQALNLFVLEPSGRYAVRAEEDTPGRLVLKGTDAAYTPAALVERLEADPAQFSPNVVLRPLMQDWLLPTAAYIAGPGETAYFAQFKALYAWAGLPMPLIYPRASATLVESKIRKILDREGIGLDALAAPVDDLFRRQVMAQMEVDLDAAFKATLAPINQAVNQLKAVATGIDATLGRTAEALRATLMKEINQYKQKVVRAEKRNHDQLKEQLVRAQENLYPAGKLQERRLSVLYFLNKYGTDLPARWLDTLPLETDTHHVIDL